MPQGIGIDGEVYDLSGMIDYTGWGQKAFGVQHGITSFPAVVHYNNDAGEECLRYIAAKHAPGPVPKEGQEAPPTFELIKQAFEEYKPDFVIAEGFEKSQYEWLHYACDNPQYYDQKNPGEAIYTVIMAKSHGVRFTSGEPADKDILEAIQKQGYTADDMAALYLIMYVAQGFRNNEIKTESEIPAFVNNIGEKYQTLFGKPYTYADCEHYMIEHYGRPWNLAELKDTERTVGKKDGERLQKFEYEIGVMRDKEALTTILDARKEGRKKILVVYGGSHYYVQHQVLDKYFGKPRFTKPPSRSSGCAIL